MRTSAKYLPVDVYYRRFRSRHLKFNRRIRRACVFALFLVFLGTGLLTAAAEQPVSIDQALLSALEHNPELRALRHALEAQKMQIGIAQSFVLPKITFEERYMRTNNPTYAFMAKLNQERFGQTDFAIDSLNDPRPVSDFQTSFSFEQPVYAAPAYIGIDMAQQEMDALRDDLERKKEEVAFRVFQTFIGAQTARAFISVAETGFADAEEHLRISRKRLDAQVGLFSDVLRAEVALAASEAKLVTAKKNYEVAKRALGLLTGASSFPDVSDERPVIAPAEASVYEESAKSRSDVRAMERRVLNAGNSLRIANAGYLPLVGIGGSYQFNDHANLAGSEGESWMVSAFLRWNIFDGLKRERERSLASARIRESREYLDALKRRVSFEVYEAYLTVEEKQKALELANAALESAEEARRLVKMRYENSLSTFADLLDVQTSLDGSRANVAQRNGAYLVSIAHLWFQSGTILSGLGLDGQEGEE